MNMKRCVSLDMSYSRGIVNRLAIAARLSHHWVTTHTYQHHISHLHYWLACHCKVLFSGAAVEVLHAHTSQLPGYMHMYVYTR